MKEQVSLGWSIIKSKSYSCGLLVVFMIMCVTTNRLSAQMNRDTLEFASESDDSLSMSKGILSITAFHRIIKKNRIVLLDYTADWCPPCLLMRPRLNKLEKDCGDSIEVVRVDVDKSQELVGNMQIASIPFFMLFKDGKFVRATNGAISYKALKQFATK